MKDRKLDKLLQKMSDEELRDLIKKVKLSRRGIKKTENALWSKLWKIKTALANFNRIQRTARVVRGKRKGKDCPALYRQKRAYGIEFFECRARNTYTDRRNKEELYRDFCHSCRLTHKKAKIRTTWKGVFENGK